jgi:hypothetical protein
MIENETNGRIQGGEKKQKDGTLGDHHHGAWSTKKISTYDVIYSTHDWRFKVENGLLFKRLMPSAPANASRFSWL